jgi:hypothetical protein
MCDDTMTRLVWIKRKSVAAVVICAVLAAASFAFWQMNQSAQAAVIYPHPGLVGWWRFDEGSGTAAGDSSGNGNNGTLQGSPLPSWVTGIFGTALQFDGLQNHVDVPSSASLNPSSQFTLVAWVNIPSGATATYMSVVAKESTYYLRACAPASDSAKLCLWYGNGTSWKSGVGANVDLRGTGWRNLVGVCNGSSLFIYLDGVLQGTATMAASVGPNTNPAVIGYRQSGNEYFNGTMDNVQIYNRALSAGEIQAAFQKGPDFSPNLTAKIPKSTTQVIVTLSWRGTGSINATVTSPSQNYTEDQIPVYAKTTYSTTSDNPSMLNVKRLSISVTALTADQSWTIALTFDTVVDYQISVEVQK